MDRHKLKELKVGDFVIVGRCFGDGVFVEKVIKVTPRIITTTPNRKYSRETGDAWGRSGSMFSSFIQARVLNTPEDFDHADS